MSWNRPIYFLTEVPHAMHTSPGKIGKNGSGALPWMIRNSVARGGTGDFRHLGYVGALKPLDAPITADVDSKQDQQQVRSGLSQGINRESYAPCSPRAPRRLPRIKTPLRRDSGRGHARLGKGCILIGLNFPVYSNISTLTVPLLASCSAEENRTDLRYGSVYGKRGSEA